MWFTELGCSLYPGVATVYGGYTTLPGGSVVPTVVNLIEADQSPTPGKPPSCPCSTFGDKSELIKLHRSGGNVQRQLRHREQRQRER
jgi:hypothetical protein